MIKNYRPPMEYRRFGKTEEYVSAITLGGMRYRQDGEVLLDGLPKAMVENATKIVGLALEAGVNCIESADCYTNSEACYGRVLHDELAVPRESFYMMTKGMILQAAEVRRRVEEQLERLKMDYLDFYTWHSLNTMELFEQCCASGGPAEELLKLKEEGLIRHVGFSTHGRPNVIIKAIETGLFDYVSLHYYYFFQRNRAALDLAAAHDMGVFIISPNDKGGQLFNPPPLLRELTEPLTPIQWNARFCLSTPEVQTLSFGMNEPEHIEEMLGIFPAAIPLSAADQNIHQKLNSRITHDPVSAYMGYDLEDDPSGINIPAFLQYRRMWKCYDMLDFGLYRYNMHSEGNHWVPGKLAFPENVELIDTSKVPAGIDIKAMLTETHEALYRAKED